jgi:hypothetical protein
MPPTWPPSARATSMGQEGGGNAGMETPLMIELLKVTGIGRALARAIRLCKGHGHAPNEREGWEAATESGGGTLASMKAIIQNPPPLTYTGLTV